MLKQPPNLGDLVKIEVSNAVYISATSSPDFTPDQLCHLQIHLNKETALGKNYCYIEPSSYEIESKGCGMVQ